MPSVCFYFQVHQPYRLRRYSIFDIGNRHDYFDDDANAEILRKVAAKCYLPMNALLEELIVRHEGRFRVAFSLTGTVVEQLERWSPETLASFRELVDTGSVELLSETYFHSLSFLYSREEFDEQIALHRELMQKHFGVRPSVFRNTELIFDNDLATHLSELGFAGVLAEGADRVLGWRSPHFAYASRRAPDLKLLLKSYRLSDDIAFRFGNRAWSEHPLTAERYASWIRGVAGCGDTVNLFMDYETFGEHQWADTGIFEFMRRLPAEVLGMDDWDFLTPSEVLERNPAVATLDFPDHVSWADSERDLTAWTGNEMQRSALAALGELRSEILDTQDDGLLCDWRRLTTSDHFYYMCTKYFADGDVHKYFSPYESPYEAYVAFMNALSDLERRTRTAPATRRAA